MHTVERIQIEGFRGRADKVEIDFDESVNFIIGRNGTGKTSLINLINAALSGDVAGLQRAQFTEITVRLKPAGSSRRPLIRYFKGPDEEGDEVLLYSIQSKTSDSVYWQDIEFDESSWASTFQLSLMGNSKSRRRPSPMSSDLRGRISKFLKTTWLSVHRANNNPQSSGDRLFESPVDQRMHDVFQKFGAFFSTLDTQSAKQTDRFQTNYFLSLISPPQVDAFSGDAGQISPEAEKQALREMFSEFGLEESVYRTKLNGFIKRVVRAVELRRESPDRSLPADTFLTLTDALRIDALVSEWAELIKEREDVYAPKIDFINIINSLLYKKEIRISSGNQPMFFNESGDEVSPDLLSSGEKQLLIILGEALIQRGESFVFLADEPELSLHIDWQEKLVPSLRQINPSSQIIFATHSPDIVGAFGKNTIDLERVLS